MVAAQQFPQPRTITLDPADALEDMVARYIADTGTTKGKAVAFALQTEESIGKIEGLLPDAMKGQASRLVKRAMLTFARKPDLQTCSTASFIRCVLDAAELGLAIDGRLGHAVPFNNKVKEKGEDGKVRERWVKEAQFMPDYKGLIAIARRGNLIRDAKADLVYSGEHFVAERVGAEDRFEHRKVLGPDKGKVVGAYAILVLPDGKAHWELMDVEDLDRIRQKSKAKDNGPWVTDTAEMRRKTVVKRALKYFSEDPAMVRALEIDDREYEEPEGLPTNGATTLPQGRTSLRAAPQTTYGAEDEGEHSQAEAPEPTVEEGREGLEREDANRVLAERIAAADTAAELDACGAETLRVQDFVGPFAAGKHREAIAARRAELGLESGE